MNRVAIRFSDARGCIRLATEDAGAARALLEWENVSRAFSLDQRPIRWEEHWAWYRRMASSNRDLLLLVEDPAATPVGSVNFKHGDGLDARVGVIVRPESRGQGWGRWAISAGCRLAFRHRPYRRILADVRSDNAGSIAAFLASGFAERAASDRPQEGMRTFTLPRPAPREDGRP